VNSTGNPEEKQTPPQAPAQADNKRTIDSADIFQGQHEIIIQHDGEQYRLRLTRNGKLILHK